MSTFRKIGVINYSPTRTRLSGHQRMTLGKLLLDPTETGRKQQPGGPSSLRQRIINNEPTVGRSTLVDLLSSSLLDMKKNDDDDDDDDHHQQVSSANAIMKESKRRGRRVVSKVSVSPGVRFRFIKRPWRPMLVAIPEGKLLEQYY